MNAYGKTDAPAGVYTQVSASNTHTCGLRNDGSLSCWGLNDNGQTVTPAGNYIQVSAGQSYTCGLKNDGNLLCWGINDYGQSKSYISYPIIDNAQWLSSVSYQATYDITSVFQKDTYRVVVSDAVGLDSMRVASFSNANFNVDYAGFISDKTPPLKPLVIASGNGSLTSLSVSWSSSDPESPLIQYRYAIGTTPGGRDVVDWTYVSSTTTSMTRSGLNLTYGQPYYVSAGARNEGGLWSDSGISNGITAGIAPPVAFNKSSPANGAGDQPSSLTLNWIASTGAASYEYCYDTTNDNTCSSWVDNGTSTSKALSDLSINTTYYWGVRANNMGGTTYANTGTWWSFTTLNNITPITLPTPWIGGISITSDKNVVAVGRPHIGSEIASYDGFSAGALTAYVPMLFKDAFGGSYDSALYIQNVNASTTANISIKYYTSTGALSCTVTDTISALASKGYWLPGLSAACLSAGWVGGGVVYFRSTHRCQWTSAHRRGSDDL